jgi:hypothetical protein
MKKCLSMLLFACAANAETFVLWHPMWTNQPPASAYRAIKVGDTNDPDYKVACRMAAGVSLWDTETGDITPWAGSDQLTQDAAEVTRTNRYTDAQKSGHRAIKAVKQAVGLPPKTGKRETLQYLIEQSRTNANTQALKIQWSLYMSQVLAGKELLENVKQETPE